MLPRRLGSVLLLLPLLSACQRPDPLQSVELAGLETYWAIDSSAGPTTYLAPVARLTLRNKGATPLTYLQATATFRRKGENPTWGGDWKQVTSAGKPLAPGQTALVVLKSDARYYSTGGPESMFGHGQFKDAQVEVFVRVGSSDWARIGAAEIERRIGSKAVEPFVR